MRYAIAEAAVNCDFSILQTLALSGRGEFHVEEGETTKNPTDLSPAEFWQREERAGREPLRVAVELLRMPHSFAMVSNDPDGGERYHWPWAWGTWEEDSASLTPLSRLYGRDAIAAAKRADRYSGMHMIAITEFGDWYYFALMRG